MPLPSNYLEILLGGGMICVSAMTMYWGGILQVLLESLTKGPCGFSYVFIITGKVTTLEPVYGPTLVAMGSLSLGQTSRFLMVLLPLKWICIPYLPQILLMLLQRSCMYGMTMGPLVLTSLLVGWVPVVPWLLALSLTSLVDLVSLFLHLVQSQFGIVTIGESFPEMLHFILQELRIATDMALLVRVLMTLYLAERWWWLSHCK